MLAGAPVMARVDRSGFVESVHRALACVTTAEGAVQAAWGEPDAVIYPRSSNKPLQALAMVGAGLDLPPQLLALVCSSHSGERFHLEGVRSILERHGLSVEDLQNTPDLPYDDVDRRQWLREGRIQYREDVVQGLANAPEAFFGLLKGRNFGKLVVKLD